MKLFFTAVLMLLPSLTFANPLGLALRAGPVWRDVTESKLAFTGTACNRKYFVDEKTDLQMGIGVTIAPSLRIYEGLSLVGSATRIFALEDEHKDVNEFAAQLEYKWGDRYEVTRVVESNVRSDASYWRESAREHEQLHRDHALILESQARQERALSDLQSRPVAKPCTTVVAPEKACVTPSKKCPPNCKHRTRR